MAKAARKIGPNKSASTLLVLFVPSHDRDGEPIDHAYWVREALSLFGGAIAFPQGQGVWRDDERGGSLVFDQPTVIQCYTSDRALGANAAELPEFLIRMGTESHQGAVGLVIDRDYLEIQFPMGAD